MPLPGAISEEQQVTMTPEQAVTALTIEQKKHLNYIAHLEADNAALKTTVNQLENQIATGKDLFCSFLN